MISHHASAMFLLLATSLASTASTQRQFVVPRFVYLHAYTHSPIPARALLPRAEMANS
jgi:hypothetical protein